MADPSGDIKGNELRKVKAEADKAEAEAAKAIRERDEYDNPFSRSKREAQVQADIAKARKDVAEARFGQYTSIVPDLSKVDRER